MAKKLDDSDYSALIEYVFSAHYRESEREFIFARDELIDASKQLGVPRPKNIGDVVYAFRYRKQLPQAITKTQPEGFEWIIQGAGRAAYRFRLMPHNRILPRRNLYPVKIPDSTPEIIGNYALGDEQALLAKVRYNRLIDVFLGITAYSLQNHLRTSVKGIGQIEIDEIYVAVDKHGRQYVIPVQAKGGHDQHGVVQTTQDIACCASRFPGLICRPVSVQFMEDGTIAMFELIENKGVINVLDEKHYQLVPASSITREEMAEYGRRAN